MDFLGLMLGLIIVVVLLYCLWVPQKVGEEVATKFYKMRTAYQKEMARLHRESSKQAEEGKEVKF